MRMRGSILPREVWRSRAASSPPSRIAASLSRMSETSDSIAAALAMNSRAPGSMWLTSAVISEQLDGDCGGFASSDAQTRNAALQTALSQRMQQGHENARTRRTDGMAERAGPAIHIDLFMRQIELAHHREGHDGKGFIDFKQVGFALFPADLLQQFFDGADRCGGEPCGCLRVSGMAEDSRQRLNIAPFGFRRAHQHERRGAVGNSARIC